LASNEKIFNRLEAGAAPWVFSRKGARRTSAAFSPIEAGGAKKKKRRIRTRTGRLFNRMVGQGPILYKKQGRASLRLRRGEKAAGAFGGGFTGGQHSRDLIRSRQLILGQNATAPEDRSGGYLGRHKGVPGRRCRDPCQETILGSDVSPGPR